MKDQNAQNYDYRAAIARRKGSKITTGKPENVNGATNVKAHAPFAMHTVRPPVADVADNQTAWFIRARMRAESEGNVLRAMYGAGK